MSRFVYEAGLKLNEQDGNKYSWKGFDLKRFADEQYFWVSFKGAQPTGFLMASMYVSFFDSRVKMMRQNLLYSLPNTRSSLLLLKTFVDFAKTQSKHTISAIGLNTNIKPRSLERLGFKKMETLYRMEN